MRSCRDTCPTHIITRGPPGPPGPQGPQGLGPWLLFGATSGFSSLPLYLYPGGSNAYSSPTNVQQMRVPSAGTFTSLVVTLPQPLPSGSATFNVQVNGTPTGLVVTLTAASGSSWGADNAHFATFSMYDIITMTVSGMDPGLGLAMTAMLQIV